MDAARDPGGRGALPASGSAGCLALPGAAAPHGQGGTSRGGRDPAGGAVHPHRRARSAARQLPGPAEDVPPRLHFRGPRGSVRERHVQGPDRARRRDRDRNPRSEEHATEPRVSRYRDSRHRHRQHPDEELPGEARLVEGVRPARHRGAGGGDRTRAPEDAGDTGPPARSRTLRPLCPRRTLDVRSLEGVAQPRLPAAGALRQLSGADRVLLRQRGATAQADQGDVQAVRGSRGGRGDAQGSWTVEAGRGGEGPDRPLQRPGGLHHVLGAVFPSRDDRPSA